MRNRLEMRSSVPFAQTPSWLLSGWEQHSNALLGLQQKSTLRQFDETLWHDWSNILLLGEFKTTLFFITLSAWSCWMTPHHYIWRAGTWWSPREWSTRGLQNPENLGQIQDKCSWSKGVQWLVLTSLLAEKSGVCNVSQRTPAACGENIAMTWIVATTNISKYKYWSKSMYRKTRKREHECMKRKI